MVLVKRGVIVLLVAAFTATCGGSDPPAPENQLQAGGVETEGLIVVLGDSLTAGPGVGEDEAWPALVERRLRSEGFPWKVHNAGVSGETSSGARGRTGWILRLEPHIVVLETGGNDGLRGIPPRVLRENIDAILGELDEAGVTVILAGMRMVENLGAGYTREFAEVYPHLAKKHDVALIPFLLEGIAGKRDFNLDDGIHPNAEGHRRITEVVYPYVLEAVKSVRNNGVSP